MHGLTTICHEIRKDGHNGSRRPKHRRASALLTISDARVVVEDANISARVREGAHVIDWQVTIRCADGNAATLKPWPFSGLTFHGRREAGEKVEIHDPNGLVKRGGSPWNKAAGNWPDAAWYDLVLTGKDGRSCGLAMIGHRDNGKAVPAGDAPSGDDRQSWNMNPGLRFMAPSVTAAKAFTVTKDRPLVLRYRLVAHDGPPPTELLNKLARE
jgi:hypothetical protein